MRLETYFPEPDDLPILQECFLEGPTDVVSDKLLHLLVLKDWLAVGVELDRLGDICNSRPAWNGFSEFVLSTRESVELFRRDGSGFLKNTVSRSTQRNG